ncbi:DEAD/DEAH box helicase, partial [Ralstonia pickettii]|uniref:DEAD/DEAH box helicase n=1 Tax=Ralstonia pickettii TaxID=329 RepID=UPI002D76ADA2
MKETTAYSRRPHQELAIADVIAGFQTDDRGQLVMACGTGKTLTGLWIKEDLCAELTLVLVPSIALLDQFASEWRKHFSSKQPYAALCVCSDETVGRNASRDRDTIQFTAEDLAHDGFDVTSAPECIAAFLVQRGRKVVFSTYQSSHLIAEAQADEAVPAFDLAIADEAHRCAGDPTSVFATILKEGKIRARKRLFTTATPRIYGRRKGQKEFGESVVDMSDEALFGPRFHTLTFGEAIRLDLLSDYRVVIMLIDDAEIQAVLKVGQSGADLSDDEKHKWLRAAQVGFLKTVRQFDLRRVISFHSYVKNARVFADDLPAVADVMWADESGTGVPKADFISGEMSAEVRKRKLAEFRATEEGEYRVLTNARCLTEGIDVPDIDGVAFVDPRSGHVDIIQALGRAIRKHERKKYGTVILPVFLGRGDSADEVIENSHFKPVWDVLNALRAHDADFETALNTRRQAGGGAEPGMADPFEKIEILGAEHVVGLAATLEPLLLNELTDGWEEGVGTARAYFEQYGHCNAADGSRWPEGDPKGYPLGTWLVNQRQARKAGKLSAERAQRLDALG